MTEYQARRNLEQAIDNLARALARRDSFKEDLAAAELWVAQALRREQEAQFALRALTNGIRTND